MSLIKKYPLPVYDPPVTYNEFNGGINTSLSNEALQSNELRDALNCHYINDALVNRPGATLVTNLNFPESSDRYQGDFFFSAINNIWIISVRNGKIYYGIFNRDSSTKIDMTQLIIKLVHTENFDDTDNYLVNIPEYTEDEIDMYSDHNGFILKYTNPDDTEAENLIVQNKKRVQGIPITRTNSNGVKESFFLLASGTRLLKITETLDENDAYKLTGEIMSAYTPNAWEYQNIGVNNLSPFPNYHITEVNGVPNTTIGYILCDPKELDLAQTSWKFKAIVSTLTGYDKTDFYYKWEVKYKYVVNGVTSTDTGWKALLYWNKSKNTDSKESKACYEITTSRSEILDLLGIENMQAYNSSTQTGGQLLIRCALTDTFEMNYNLSDNSYTYETDADDGDWVSSQASAIYSRTHVTKNLYETYEPSVNDVDQYFYYIHSCTKITADGQKALLYDDAYESCQWFKTVVGEYDYISYVGGLDFSTTKNEKLIAVKVFDTNIVVFADNEQLGGNISVVTGNGDDYNADDYYSPYKRSIVNTSVSCDSYNSIQICDNNIIFKYRDDIYILDTDDLSNSDTVRVLTINDQVKQKLNNIEMPLDRIREPRKDEDLTYDFHELNRCLKPDEIFSEVTDGFYSLIFPRQGTFRDVENVPSEITKLYGGTSTTYKGKTIEDVNKKPGLRWKCYFREGKTYSNKSKETYPWLRDVSPLFDIVSVLSIDGDSAFVRKNGDIIMFNDASGNSYTDENFKLRISTKAYDMDNAALCKFMDNLCVYYNKDYSTKIMLMNIYVRNESSFYIYTPESEAYISTANTTDQVKYGSLIDFDDALNLREKDLPISQYRDIEYIDPMDRPIEILNEYEGEMYNGSYISPALNRPEFTSKTCTPKYRFPFLSAQVIIEMSINQAFNLSSLNFSYTTSDTPDFTREKLYRDIIRNTYD